LNRAVRHVYAVAIGSNQPQSRCLTPRRLVERAIASLADAPFALLARSPVMETAPLGPSKRRYANAAALIGTKKEPEELLAYFKGMERAAGRRRGRRWGTRTLDLDIILWSGGCWAGKALVIPHPRYRERGFVLDPLCAIVPDWRDPLTGRSVWQERARLKKPRKLPEAS